MSASYTIPSSPPRTISPKAILKPRLGVENGAQVGEIMTSFRAYLYDCQFTTGFQLSQQSDSYWPAKDERKSSQFSFTPFLEP